MRYAELEALAEAGDVAAVEAALAADAAQVTPALSGHQVQLLTAKIERVKTLAGAVAAPPPSADAPAEEPTDVEAEDSEPEPKAEPDQKARRSFPRGSARKKG